MSALATRPGRTTPWLFPGARRGVEVCALSALCALRVLMAPKTVNGAVFQTLGCWTVARFLTSFRASARKSVSNRRDDPHRHIEFLPPKEWMRPMAAKSPRPF